MSTITPPVYIAGQSRDHDHDNRVTHLYEGPYERPGNPLCARGWSRENGTAYSIWRGNVSEVGICKICQRRAEKGLPGVPSKKFTEDIMSDPFDQLRRSRILNPAFLT